jgi:carotenoid cleavage dioxygenase-like enzyme
MNSPLYEIGLSTLEREIQLDDVPVRGYIPAWLNGTLVRTGPAKADNANVNVGLLADRYIAMTETTMPIVFDPETLSTAGRFDYGDKVEGLISTAHPHFDFNRHQTFNYCAKLSRKSAYQIFSIGAGKGRVRLVGSISVDKPAYMHSFGMSERYIILVEFPLVVSPLKLLLSGKPFIENYQWKPERGTRFWVISKDGGELVASSEGEACFAFHHVNAFEQGDEIVLDLGRSPLRLRPSDQCSFAAVTIAALWRSMPSTRIAPDDSSWMEEVCVPTNASLFLRRHRYKPHGC